MRELKVDLANPIVIAESPFVNEPGVDRWGFYQFPVLDRLLDGRIAVTFHINADSALAYGKGTLEPNRSVSSDGGLTWERVTSEAPRAGLLLSNGEQLRVGMADLTPPTHPIEKYDLPPSRGRTIGSYGQQPYVCYRHGELPPELQGVPSARLAVGGTAWTPERARLDDPDLLRHSAEGVFPVTWWGDVHLTLDGSLVGVVYPCRIEGKDFGPWHCGCYRSDDLGRSWQLQGRILYRPGPTADRHDGFTEPASVVLPDGELLAILRTTDGFGDGPMYQTRSRDGGVQWDEPKILRANGVLPRLLRLNNGVLVMSTGRPGADLNFSADGRGEMWSDRFPLVPLLGPGNQDDSCGYTSLLALDANTFLVAYSWFQKPAGPGKTSKAVLVQRVRVTP